MSHKTFLQDPWGGNPVIAVEVCDLSMVPIVPVPTLDSIQGKRP